MLVLIAATLLILERRFWRLLFGWRLPPSNGFYLLPFVEVWRSTTLGDWLSPYVAEDDLLSDGAAGKDDEAMYFETNSMHLEDVSVEAVRDNIANDEHSAEGVLGSTRSKEKRLSHRFVSPGDAQNSYLPRVPGAVLESSMQKGEGKKRSSAPERS